MHDLGHIAWVGSVLHISGTLITAGLDPDDVDRDLSEMSNTCCGGSKRHTLSLIHI